MRDDRSFTEFVVRNCAPTLANLKTGSLFSCAGCVQCDVYAEIRELNKILVKKGLRLIPIETKNKSVLIYLYRVRSLCEDFAKARTRQILKKCGYTDCCPESCIKHLIERLKYDDAFPHEIGLFLGYPPEDVESFMEDSTNYLFVGTWKVYHNAEKAKKTFEAFRRCGEIYINCYRKGRGLEKLAVAG